MSRRLRSYQKTLLKSPNDTRAWYGLGIELLELDQIEQGCIALRECATRCNDAPLCASAGRLLAMQRRHAWAVEALRKGLVLSSGNGDIATDLARSLLAQANSLAAVEVLRSYVRHSTDPDVCLVFAYALIREGFDSEAAEHLERGLGANGSHVPSLRLLADIRIRNRQSTAAVECLRRVLALTTAGETEDLLALGRALADSGQHDEAIRILSEARRRAPESYEILANLGNAYLAMGSAQPAIEVLVEAIRIEPNGAHAQCMLGVALHQIGRSAEGVDRLRDACRLAPHWAAAHFNLGRLLYGLGDNAGAKKALGEAQRLAPDDPVIREALEKVPVTSGDGDLQGGRFTGNLEMFRLPELLEFLRLQRSTGVLMLGARNGAGLVRLFEGSITSAYAPSTPRLGEILVKQGAIDKAALDDAITRQGQKDVEHAELLGTILIERQLVSLEKLERAMMDQVIAAIGEMMDWTSGHFAFHSKPPSSPPSITFDAQGLMMEAARLSDEASRDESRI
jgi:Flp pilus assembly protein TadD